MSYTPVELRHVRVGRSLFGYNRAMVEQVIEEVAQSFEATWRERGELAERVETLEKQLEELRRREGLLTQTLVAAEQAASDVRERARREAETITAEAHTAARAVARAAEADRERLTIESRRIEGMLRAALGLIEERTHAVTSPPAVTPSNPGSEAESGEASATPWAREDTREFEPIAPAQIAATDEQRPVVEQPLFEQRAPEPAVLAQPSPAPEPAPAVSSLPFTGAGMHGWPEAGEDVRAEEPPAPEVFGPAPVQLPTVWALPEPPEAEEPQPVPFDAEEDGTAHEDAHDDHDEERDPLDQPEAWTAAGSVLRRIPGPESRNFDWGD